MGKGMKLEMTRCLLPESKQPAEQILPMGKTKVGKEGQDWNLTAICLKDPLTNEAASLVAQW